ncbi:hypothetical protein ACWGR4_35770 [Embleya sp. NPDC055664]
MTRTDVLRDLVVSGRTFDVARLGAVAAELGLPVSDVFVLAGQPVPARLLPPVRSAEALETFAYNVTFCGHAQLAVLEGFVSALAAGSRAPGAESMEETATVPEVGSSPVSTTSPGVDGFARILAGLMANRGFGREELPFTGLSQSTIRRMLHGHGGSSQSVEAMSAVLGWTFVDLAAVADVPVRPFSSCAVLCHHVGRVYVAAIPLTTAQLVRAAEEADRLSGRIDQGVWKPWSAAARRGEPCPR